MTLEDILYEAHNKGVKSKTFAEVERLRTLENYKYVEIKDIFQDALMNVLKEIKLNENIQK